MRTAALCISSLALIGAGPVSLSALCPKAKPDETVVCADIDPPRSRFRVREGLPPIEGSAGAVSVSRERNALFDYDAGGAGTCSNVGGSGGFGCFVKGHKARAEQRANARDRRGQIYDASPD